MRNCHHSSRSYSLPFGDICNELLFFKLFLSHIGSKLSEFLRPGIGLGMWSSVGEVFRWVLFVRYAKEGFFQIL